MLSSSPSSVLNPESSSPSSAGPPGTSIGGRRSLVIVVLDFGAGMKSGGKGASVPVEDPEVSPGE